MPFDYSQPIPDEFKCPAVEEAVRRLTETVNKMRQEAWRAGYEKGLADAKVKHDALADRIAHPYLGLAGWNFPPSA